MDNRQKHNRQKLQKAGFDFSEPHYIDVIAEYTVDAGDLQDGYGSSALTERRVICPINAKLEVESLIRSNLNNFRKKKTTQRGSVINTFHGWIEDALGFTDAYKMNCFMLNNGDRFACDIQESTLEYKEFKDEQLANEEPETDAWNLSSAKYNRDTYEKFDAKKYSHKDCYLRKDRSRPERAFEAFIDSRESTEWWYKNGDNGKEHLGVRYAEGGKDHAFYPDYIMCFDGKVRLYDVKAGNTLQVAGTKAKALYGYCQANNVTGGIVKQEGTLWKVNAGQDLNDPTQWKEF
jgi:hypothetical protein